MVQMLCTECVTVLCISGGDLEAGAEFGGTEKSFRGPRFLNDVYSGKYCDLFFSHRLGFSDFTSLYCIKMSYTTLSSQEETTISKKKSLIRPFLLYSYFRDNTTSLNIGGTNAWAVPTSNFFGGASPQF